MNASAEAMPAIDDLVLVCLIYDHTPECVTSRLDDKYFLKDEAATTDWK